MAFDTELSPEELVIRLKEAALRQNLNAVRICLVAMVVFGLLAFSLRAASTGNADQFLSLVMGFLCLLFFCLSAISWVWVCHDRELLAHLKAAAASINGSHQSGVWPPPPSATN